MLSRKSKSGFTLVEILIVVIILGILAAVVIPQFTNASQDARKSSLKSLMQTLRSQVELYKLQHGDQPPDLLGTGATGQWFQLLNQTTYGTTACGPYLQQTPKNAMNTFATIASAPGASVGFVFDATSGKLYATGVDATKYFNEETGDDVAAAPF